MKEQFLELNGADVQNKLERIPMPESGTAEIQQDLSSTVFGQEEALETISKRIGIIEAGLSQRNKPLGAIFMLGATGIGKTETAHAIADRWFDNPDSERLRIINCAEFTEPHTITRIVGSPPSYVGYSEKGALPHSIINAQDKDGNIQRSIVLLDEFEKAHTRIHQAFLGALDKGRLNARNGEAGIQPLDFTNTLFLFTSNISADKIQTINEQREIGFNSPDGKDNRGKRIEAAVKQEMNNSFSPEFRNRLTDTVIFKTLERNSGAYEKIFYKFMEGINQDMAIRLKGNTPYLMATKELMSSVIDSIDITYGARDLKRAIETQILSEFTNLLMGADVAKKIIVAHREESGEVGFYTEKQTIDITADSGVIFEPNNIESKKKLPQDTNGGSQIGEPHQTPRDTGDEDDNARKELDQEQNNKK